MAGQTGLSSSRRRPGSAELNQAIGPRGAETTLSAPARPGSGLYNYATVGGRAGALCGRGALGKFPKRHATLQIRSIASADTRPSEWHMDFRYYTVRITPSYPLG